VNAAQPDGATALAWAAHSNDLETAELLIRAGANVNAANDYGVTPLSLACTNGNAAMVNALLAARANPNAALAAGETVLMTCARSGNVDAVQALLAHGADVNAKETRGQTPLMWAVAEKHPAVARALIERGADVQARSKGGFTPLLLAARHGDLASARLLLEAGANVNDSTPEEGSALVVASGSGHEALAIFLLEKGADPNVADRNGATALHYAMLKAITPYQNITQALAYLTYVFRPNMVELVKALLQHGANPNVRLLKTPRLPNGRSAMITLAGATPFWLAAGVGDVAIMRLLVEKGADPLLATSEGVTPLMAAAGLGRRVNGHMDRTAEEEKAALEAVQLALELGGDIHATTETSLTAMHGAAYAGANTIIQFLVDKGAKVDVQDKYGQTPLSIAQRSIPQGLPNKFQGDQVYDKTVALLRELGGETQR
jgi:ankyrin repeat protein